MAKLPDETLTTIFTLQRQLVEGIKLIPPLEGVGFRGHGAWGMGHGCVSVSPMPTLAKRRGVDSSQTDQRWDSSPFSLMKQQQQNQ